MIKAPDGYDLPGASERLAGKFDFVQVFVKSEAELAKLAPRAGAALEPGGILWISFPKGSSKIQTDLTRDKGWDSVRKLPLKWITLISVNGTWSAFGMRPLKKGEEASTW